VKKLINYFSSFAIQNRVWLWLNRKHLVTEFNPIASEIKRNGIYITSLSELGYELKPLLDYVAAVEDRGIKDNKPFLKYLWNPSPEVDMKIPS